MPGKRDKKNTSSGKEHAIHYDELDQSSKPPDLLHKSEKNLSKEEKLKVHFENRKKARAIMDLKT